MENFFTVFIYYINGYYGFFMYKNFFPFIKLSFTKTFYLQKKILLYKNQNVNLKCNFKYHFKYHFKYNKSYHKFFHHYNKSYNKSYRHYNKSYNKSYRHNC